MSSIDRLRKAMSAALTVAVEAPTVPRMLEEQLQGLRETLGSAGTLMPPRDRMREAISRFRDTGQLGLLGDARLVCFGCAERFDPTELPLIEEERSFSLLLESVDLYAQEPRSLRRCYRGLLFAYFTYDGEGQAACEVGRVNWRDLRNYLSARRTAIRAEGVEPEWVEAINGHANLLTDDPVARYAGLLLGGDADEVTALKSRLEIRDTSWLIRRLILGQLVFASRASDHSFKVHTEQLLCLLDDHPLLENEGLTLILERYARISSPEPHAALRDRAIASWGNPNFRRHSPEWTRVSELARKMVATWATLDIIREFFEVLSEDRRTDKRRIKFWQRYHQEIGDMYFALGSNALHARDADVERVRKKMGDHLLVLKRGGPPSNNAFIMLMGDIVVVEFGVKGHACYLYKKSELPFSLQGEVTGDRDGLRSLRHLERLTHMDGSFQSWEDKVEAALARRRIRAGTDPSARSSAWNPSQPPRETKSKTPPVSGFWRDNLLGFAREHRLEVVDNTDKGGNIWIMFPEQAGFIAERLKAWGFAFSEKRSAWWRKQWP